MVKRDPKPTVLAEQKSGPSRDWPEFNSADVPDFDSFPPFRSRRSLPPVPFEKEANGFGAAVVFAAIFAVALVGLIILGWRATP